MARCEAVQVNDEMKCGRCRLSWDVSDEDPPACPRSPSVDAAVTPPSLLAKYMARVICCESIAFIEDGGTPHGLPASLEFSPAERAELLALEARLREAYGV